MTTGETIPKPGGLYKIREAARLVTWADGRALNKHLSKQQARDWVDNNVGLLRWADIPGGKKRITFRALISLRVIFRLHYRGMSCEAITGEAARLGRVLGVEWPFASKAIWALEDDQLGKLFPPARSSESSSRENAYRHWQIYFQRIFLLPPGFANGLEFDEDGVACAWQPDTWVRLEPGMVSGRPCVARTRIPTWIIRDMSEGGDSVEEIADWYDLDEERVRNAVEWEKQLASVVV